MVLERTSGVRRSVPNRAYRSGVGHRVLQRRAKVAKETGGGAVALVGVLDSKELFTHDCFHAEGCNSFPGAGEKRRDRHGRHDLGVV